MSYDLFQSTIFEIIIYYMFQLNLQITFSRIIYRQKTKNPYVLTIIARNQDKLQIYRETENVKQNQEIVELNKMNLCRIHMIGNQQYQQCPFIIDFTTHSTSVTKRRLKLDLNSIFKHYLTRKFNPHNFPMDMFYSFSEGEIIYKLVIMSAVKITSQQKNVFHSKKCSQPYQKILADRIIQLKDQDENKLCQSLQTSCHSKNQAISKLTDTTERQFLYISETQIQWQWQLRCAAQEEIVSKQQNLELKKLKIINEDLQEEKSLDANFNFNIRAIIMLLVLGLGFLIFFAVSKNLDVRSSQKERHILFERSRLKRQKLNTKPLKRL